MEISEITYKSLEKQANPAPTQDAQYKSVESQEEALIGALNGKSKSFTSFKKTNHTPQGPHPKDLLSKPFATPSQNPDHISALKESAAQF